MRDQRKIVTLLRWVMFLALAYLLAADAAVAPSLQIGLLAVVAISNVALMRLSAGLWEHPALLPAIVVVDMGVLIATMGWGAGLGRETFFAYFALLALVALLRDLRSASAAVALVVAAYGVYLSLLHGTHVLLADPGLLGRLGFLFCIGIVYAGMMQAAQERMRAAAVQEQLTSWVHRLSAAFAEEFDVQEVIHQVLVDIQDAFPGSVRSSLVRIDREELEVIGSSDDRTVRALSLERDRYPELLAATASAEPIVIDDLRGSSLTADLRELIEDLPFASLLLCPVPLEDDRLGHIVLRVARDRGSFTPSAIATTQTIAEAIAVIFRQAKAREAMERSERMQMVSQIAASVSSSFNDILATVLLASESLRKETIGSPEVELDGHRRAEDVADRFETIELAVREGMTIVERLSAWTRAGGTDTVGARRRNRVDARRLFEEALHHVRPYWDRHRATRGLELRRQLTDTPPVSGDPGELRELLLNLLLNAVDAMPRGGVMTLGLDSDGDTVTFTVADTGIGIPEESRDKVFEPLFSTKGSAGTGLGLSVVRSVVKRHGGEIELDSAEGVGTTVRVHLPALRAEEATAEEDGQDPTPDGGRILLVEGNERVRDVMVRYLEVVGHAVDTVSGTEEALVMLGTLRPYSGVLAGLSSLGRDIRDFLEASHRHRPDLSGRTLLYSTRRMSPTVADLAERYDFAYVDRSEGLAALGRALGDLGARRPERGQADDQADDRDDGDGGDGGDDEGVEAAEAARRRLEPSAAGIGTGTREPV